jgi:hypothetical protein
MHRKFLIFSIFCLLIIVNLLIALKINLLYNKEKNIEKILAEISPLNNNQQFKTSSGPAVLGSYQTNVELSDNRIANLKNFFRKYNSPLFDYAQHIVVVSDKYHFDYRLLPAIAMQESNLCRIIPEDSHNCWGWGIYGSTVTKFDSYDEAIEVVAKGLKDNYLDHGLITATAIMEKYTPSSQGSWAKGVNTFLRMLE